MGNPVPPAPQIFPQTFDSIDEATRGFRALVETMQSDPEFSATVLGARVGNPITRFQLYRCALKKTLQNMEQDTDADREQRMLFWRRGMIEIGKRLKGA